MKLFSITKTLSTLAVVVGLSTTSQVAVSDIQIQAGTGCFPRVFSQIDQFKMSSGGLRNTNPSPRTVVCSLHNDTLGLSSSTLQVYVHPETLPAAMECTIYTRNTTTGGLVDSITTTVPAGNSGSNLIGTLDYTGSDASTVNHYLQCKVPGNGRLFSAHAYYNDA